jgi:metal-responsive CopG/Arc/MetJ family transcriptional regulator
MAARKFAISMPEDVMEQIDRAAADRGITRSRFIAEVLKKTARARTDAEITRRLNDVFSYEETTSEQRKTARDFQRVASSVGTEW